MLPATGDTKITAQPRRYPASGLEVVEDTHMSNENEVIYLEDRMPSIARQLQCCDEDIRQILDTIGGHDLESVLDAIEMTGVDIEAVRAYLGMETVDSEWEWVA